MLNIEKTGTGHIERTGTGAIERTGTGAIERTGTGAIERTGTGAIERTGTGRIGWLLGALVLMAVAAPVSARDLHTIGGLTISNSDREVIVSWHLDKGDALALVSGRAKIEAGFAVVDLYEAGALWGQLELDVDSDGTLSGTVLDFAAAKSYQLEAGGNANFLIETDDFLKIAGHGTGN